MGGEVQFAEEQRHYACHAYRDNDALQADVFNEGYTNKYFSSIPGEAACDRNCNRIMGGPQPPKDSSNAERCQYKTKRKAYTDVACRKLLNNYSATDINCLPQKEQATTAYTGEQSPHIHLMNLVENFLLMQGHTFAETETLMIRIAKEANLQNIKVRVLKS
jgi:hypothetical protein